MLSPVQKKIYSEEEDEEEILVFKIKDSDHGELLVHLKDEECAALIDKCKSLFEKFINSNDI